MSKARLVITAVLVEGRSQSQVARDYGVSQSWISRLIKRYTLEGDAAFEPRSRCPHTSPGRLPQTTIDLIIELRHTLAGKGLDAGPHKNAPSRPTFASQPNNPTNAGNLTSPTGAWPTQPTSRSCAGSTTAHAWFPDDDATEDMAALGALARPKARRRKVIRLRG